MFHSLTSDYYIPLCKQARLPCGYLLYKPNNLRSILRTQEKRREPSPKSGLNPDARILVHNYTETLIINNNNLVVVVVVVINEINFHLR